MVVISLQHVSATSQKLFSVVLHGAYMPIITVRSILTCIGQIELGSERIELNQNMRIPDRISLLKTDNKDTI